MEKKLFDKINIGKAAAAQLAEIRKDGILCSKEELKALKRLIRHGREAEDELVKRNAGMVWNIVRSTWSDKNIEEDLYQDGCLGLFKAMEKYDPERGAKYSTYAHDYVMRDVRRGIAAYGYVVKISEETMIDLGKVDRAKNAIERETGREATADEIAAHTAMPVKKVTKVLKSIPAIRFSTGFDIDTDEESGSVGLKDCLAASEDCEPEHVLMETENYRLLHEKVDALSEKERKVITLLYGLDGGRALSFAEAALYMGCSKTTVSNIKNEAIRKLRASRELQELRAA